MAIRHQFEYYAPKTLTEALDLKDKLGASGWALAGGTDLVSWLRDDIIEPGALIDIKKVAELPALQFANNTLTIGPLTTFSDLIENETVNNYFPLLMEMSKTVASVGIRNRATVIGNICSAVPSCDSGPVLQVYDAKVIVQSKNNKRAIPINQWFLGPRKTALAPNEIVLAVEIPLPLKPHAGIYVKLGRYKGEDLAQVCLAILTQADQTLRCSYGAVGPVPKRTEKIEGLLNGKTDFLSHLNDALELVPQEISPITDIRASKAYRQHMAKVMFERGLKAVISRMNGNGPAYGVPVI